MRCEKPWFGVRRDVEEDQRERRCRETAAVSTACAGRGSVWASAPRIMNRRRTIGPGAAARSRRAGRLPRADPLRGGRGLAGGLPRAPPDARLGAQRARRRAASPTSSRWACCSPRSCAVTSRSRTSPSTRAAHLPQPYVETALWGGQQGSLLLWLTILLGHRERRGAAQPQARSADVIPWTVPVLGGVSVFFALDARRGGEPVRHAGRAGRRRGPQPEPPEPVHDDPPADALPRLRGAHRAVRVRDGRAALGPHRRALDRRHAPLDARRVHVPRDRHPARREVGLRGGRLGRLLRVGSGGERRAHAVARGDGVPALGDGAGEEEHAPRLERRARLARVLPLAVRHVPHPERRDQLDPQLHAVLDRALVPRVHRRRRGVLRRS